jgi:hypothetical protein
MAAIASAEHHQSIWSSGLEMSGSRSALWKWGRAMDHTFTFSTDTATLVVGDPALIRDHARRDANWWRHERESRHGQTAVIRLGGDGVYKIRITDQNLSFDEAAYASEVVTLGLEVASGELFVGPLEYLPGEVTLPEGCFTFSLPAEEYALNAYSVAWHDAPDWFVLPDGRSPDSAPADVALVIAPRTKSIVAPATEPRLFGTTRGWVFPELPRRLGPTPGMELSTSVVRRRDDLVLKPCGPAGYRPVIHDMSTLRWRDRVRLRVLNVDHDSHEFVAEIISVETAEGHG